MPRNSDVSPATAPDTDAPAPDLPTSDLPASDLPTPDAPTPDASTPEVSAPDVQGLRERRKQSTRTALVHSALQLFAERGYGEVTVEDICSQVDVSQRTFFRYFPTKEDVLAAPLTEVLNLIRDTLESESASTAAWPSLRIAYAAASEHIEKHRTEFLRVSRIVRESPAVLASNARAITEWELAVRDNVARRMSSDPGELLPRLLIGLGGLALRSTLDYWIESDSTSSAREIMTRALDELEPGAQAIAHSRL